jgi:hypothetical protein
MGLDNSEGALGWRNVASRMAVTFGGSGTCSRKTLYWERIARLQTSSYSKQSNYRKIRGHLPQDKELPHLIRTGREAQWRCVRRSADAGRTNVYLDCGGRWLLRLPQMGRIKTELVLKMDSDILRRSTCWRAPLFELYVMFWSSATRLAPIPRRGFGRGWQQGKSSLPPAGRGRQRLASLTGGGIEREVAIKIPQR